MSIAIVGGNECMERRYIDVCKKYGYKAKVFLKTKRIREQIGSPDVLLLFTNTVSHKMVLQALSSVQGSDAKVFRSHSSSISSLSSILEAI